MPKQYCDKFWGDTDGKRIKQVFFTRYFENCKDVVDLGCGRGEFLGLLEESGIKAVGVDGDVDLINRCREAGFEVYHDDIFSFLEADHKFDGIMISHVIEHMDGVAAEKLLNLSFKMLNPGGRVAIVTPNSENLEVITNNFWLDVTHVRPYPLLLLIEMCIDSGFTIESAGEDMTSMKPGWKLQVRRKMIGPLLRLFGMGQLAKNLFSTKNIYVVGEKRQSPKAPELMDKTDLMKELARHDL